MKVGATINRNLPLPPGKAHFKCSVLLLKEVMRYIQLPYVFILLKNERSCIF